MLQVSGARTAPDPAARRPPLTSSDPSQQSGGATLKGVPHEHAMPCGFFFLEGRGASTLGKLGFRNLPSSG